MIRLKDIAVRADVSVMTVSKALRDAKDVSTATKTRIKQLAQQMGYVPDTFAQALRTRSSKIFGVVIPAITNPVLGRVVMALEEHSHQLGFELVLAQSLGTVEREETVIRRLVARKVQGLFIHPVYRLQKDSKAYQELVAHRIPTVILGHRAPFCGQFACVETDDALASYHLTKHLLELGHKRIAFFAGQIVSPSAQERFAGHRRALREVQLDVDEKLVFQGGSTLEDGAKAALQMLNESTDATAIQADNDLVAIGCADALLNQGVKIPQEISVAGFGNTLVAEYFRVPLTTTRQPKHRLGVAAMEVMTRLLRGEAIEPKRLAADLIIRASTAKPPAVPRFKKA
jgi:DNA-binding LacI/PurR family transcriptional regulator